MYILIATGRYCGAQPFEPSERTSLSRNAETPQLPLGLLIGALYYTYVL
jgi:hypothetical protein